MFTKRLYFFIFFNLLVAQWLTAQALRVESSHAAGFYDAAIQLKLTCSDNKALIFYTLDGSTPGKQSAKIKSGATISIDKHTVLRFRAKSGKQSSDVETYTFFIGQQHAMAVVSIAIEPHVLFHPEKGLFVKGPNSKPNYPFRGANFWSRREYPSHIELFDEKGQLVFSDGKGFRLFGGMSRVFPQKSISIVGRKNYGKKYIKKRLFPSRENDKYKHFVLRNSGSDFCITQFRDVAIAIFGERMGLLSQAARPCVVYINGQYWGIYNMREKINRYFVEYRTGFNKDSLDLIEHRQDVKRGSIKHYNEMRAFMRAPSTNLANPAHFTKVAAMMDVDNFLNYQVLQIYVDNQDAGGNVKFFRPQTPGGKWQWVLFDTDFGMGMYETEAFKNNSLAFHTKADGPVWPNPPWSTLNLRVLLQNPDFKNRFINRFADVMNSVFKPQNCIATIDSLERLYQPEMQQHLDRWKRGDIKDWHQRVDIMRQYALQRPAFMKQFLQERFQVGEDVQLMVKVESPGGQVRLNGFLSCRDSLAGSYFKNIPIEIEAIPDFGYQFSHLSVDGKRVGEASLKHSFKNKACTVVAHFKQYTSPLAKRIIVNELYCHDEAAKDWLELYNRNSTTVDLNQWVLRVNDAAIPLPKCKIEPNTYLILAQDTIKFKKQFPACKAPLLQVPKLDMACQPLKLELLTPIGAPICKVHFTNAPGKRIYTRSLKHTKLDTENLSNWESLEEGATPGAMNQAMRHTKRKQRNAVWIALLLAAVLAGLYTFK